MGWVEKGQPTWFDDKEISGLYFLDGDVVAEYVGKDWTRGQKYPLIVFPSGVECDLWEGSHPESLGVVHLFGELDLPLRSSRDEAYDLAIEIAEACGYSVSKIGVSGLEVQGHDRDEHLHVVFDEEAGIMVDVEKFPARPEPAQIPRTMPLLTKEIRQQLPKLYENEELGLEAPVHVKFFTPDSGWTWYASEFDGEDVFFGLVSGFDIEYGNFSLKELQEAIDLLGLQIERDVHFEPKPLRELEAWHRKQREDNG